MEEYINYHKSLYKRLADNEREYEKEKEENGKHGDTDTGND